MTSRTETGAVIFAAKPWPAPADALYQPAAWGGRAVGLWCLLAPGDPMAHAECAFEECACLWDGHGIMGHGL